MRILTGLIFSVLLFWQSAQSQSFPDGFEFNLPFDDTTSAEFIPHFPKTDIDASGYVSTDGSGNFIVNGSPVKFYGVNITTRGAFPQKSDAEMVAGRMRKFGINLVRFHHIDNPWSNGSLFYNVDGTRELNATLLDRLDYFIAELKKNGIYVDMNLNVSRTFEPVDGVVDADSLNEFAKGLTQFDPIMVALQKEYAQQLLGHVNPYLGGPLAEDPVLAMVEIINENTLFRLWYSDALQPISQGGTIPVYYANQLDSLWQDFLTDKYGTTGNLSAAWNAEAITGDTIINDGFETGIGPEWVMELHETAMAAAQTTPDASAGDSALLINITNISTETWHTQYKNVGESVKNDSVYELYFTAKADAPQILGVAFSRDNSPWTYYHGQSFGLGTAYEPYHISFTAPEDNTGQLRIAFSFNNQTGNFYIDEFVFKEVSTDGLLDTETLEGRNIKRIKFSEILSYTEQRMMDLADFYAGVQTKFLSEMRVWLKDTLEVVAPLTGTNWFTGPEDVYVQDTLDYIDNHAYWDHPQFPNEPWSPTDWAINNVPMMTDSYATIESLFNGLIVKNKPYTVSEYNHPFPNIYQIEMLPIITSYLAFNGADGIMYFLYSDTWSWSVNKVESFFELHHNSNIMGNYLLFSYAFRNNLINEADTSIEINYSKDNIMRMPQEAVNSWTTHFPYDAGLCYNNKIEIRFDNESDFDYASLPAKDPAPYNLNNGQIYWDREGLFKINTPKFSSITGHLNEYGSASTDMMVLNSATGFGSVNWLTLVDSALNESSKSIFSIGTKMMNTGMIWDGTTTIHDDWGTSPALIYPLTLSISLKTKFPVLRVTPLNVYGQEVLSKAKFYITGGDGFATVNFDQYEDKTIWYSIKGITGDYSNMESFSTDSESQILCYPNPSNDIVHFKWTGNTNEPVQLLIFNVAGEEILRRDMQYEINLPANEIGKGVHIYHIITDDKVFIGIFTLH